MALKKRAERKVPPWAGYGPPPGTHGPGLPPPSYGPYTPYPFPPLPKADPDFVRLKKAASCALCSEIFFSSEEVVELHRATHSPHELWMQELVQIWYVLERLEEGMESLRNRLKQATAHALKADSDEATGPRGRGGRG